MTIITLSTVGFSEVNPLGDRGRIFTIVLILMGLVTIGYIVNRFTEALIQGYFQQGFKMRQEQQAIDSPRQALYCLWFWTYWSSCSARICSRRYSFCGYR